MALLYGLPDSADSQAAQGSSSTYGSSSSSGGGGGRQAVTLGASLSTALLKFMCGQAIAAGDVRALDPAFFKHRMEAMLQDGGVEYMKAVRALQR